MQMELKVQKKCNEKFSNCKVMKNNLANYIFVHIYPFQIKFMPLNLRGAKNKIKEFISRTN